MAAVIGALRAVMSLDSAAFQNGMNAAQKRLRSFEKSADKMGRNLRDMGTKMSLGISAPIAAIAGASMASLNSMRDLQNQAALAGESAQDFKILSIAAAEFGIQQDKLSDILKDVNDKMGDFAQTGQGPLADFFENIAPQVGLTLQSFEGLSSSDALQLYIKALEDANVSQAEMTFYLEAIASDATALLPVFRDNAEALGRVEEKARELGLSIDKDLLNSAREIDSEFRIVREVMGVQLKQALIGLMPAVSKLAEVMLPFVKDAARFISDMATGFRNLDPETQKFIVAAAGMAAAVGPLLVALGTVVSSVSSIVGVFSTLTAVLAANPIVAVLGGIALAGLAIYKNWDGLKEFFTGLFDTITVKAAEAWQRVQETFAQAGQQLVAALQQAWLAVKTEVSSWPGEFLQLGKDIIQGLVDGVLAKWEDLKSTVTGIGAGMRDSLKEMLGIKSPSRVFREIGQNAVEGLRLGLEDGEPALAAAIDRTGNTMMSLRDGVKSVFKGLVSDTQDFSASIEDTLRNLADNLISSGIDMLFNTIFGAIGGGSQIKVPNSLLSKMASFDGGGFTGRGSRVGGVDGKGGFPAILHPNETVIDHTKGQGMGGGAKLEVNIYGAPAEPEVRRGQNGRVDIDFRRAFQSEVQGGGLDRAMSQRFGLRPKAQGA
ncbi:phage tail tape measure protein [Roseovarius sp.]